MGKVIQWPYTSVLEGQGETKWFHGGKVVVVGYGFRSSKQTVSNLEKILNKIYRSTG
jgi:N-dimethylarginine dimethylaminohydrolase